MPEFAGGYRYETAMDRDLPADMRILRVTWDPIPGLRCGLHTFVHVDLLDDVPALETFTRSGVTYWLADNFADLGNDLCRYRHHGGGWMYRLTKIVDGQPIYVESHRAEIAQGWGSIFSLRARLTKRWHLTHCDEATRTCRHPGNPPICPALVR